MTPDILAPELGRIKPPHADRVLLWLDGSPERPPPQVYGWDEILSDFGMTPVCWLASLASGGMRLLRVGRDIHVYEDRHDVGCWGCA